MGGNTSAIKERDSLLKTGMVNPIYLLDMRANQSYPTSRMRRSSDRYAK